MTPDIWLRRNGSKLGSAYERLFVETVLSRIPNLDLASVTAQMPFKDRMGRQRYCDFAITEGDGVRIVIEVDGYDKTGTGTGMSKQEFKDWQRRHASLVSAGWDVLRFANADVRDQPDNCIEHIDLLLRSEREKASHKAHLEARIRDFQRKIDEVQKGQPPPDEPGVASAHDLADRQRLERETRRLKAELHRANKSRPLSSQEKRKLQNKNAEQEAHIEQLEQQLGEMLKEAGYMKHAIWALAMVICIAFIVVVFALIDYEPTRAPPGVSQLDSKPPLGKNCSNPVDWRDASDYIGEHISVRGPIVEVTRASDMTGNPTFINIGAAFPDESRLTAVIWGRNRSGFHELLSRDLVGQSVCVSGEIKSYRGAAQIELRSRGQVYQGLPAQYPTSYPGEYPGDDHG